MSREAMQMALHTLEGWANYGKWVWPETALEQAKHNTTEAITAIKEALAEPEQEPAAWMVYTQDGQSVYVTDNPTDIQKNQRALPMYTAPSKQWVGLTDQEIHEIDGYEEDRKMYRFARYIEAKLKEKNT